MSAAATVVAASGKKITTRRSTGVESSTLKLKDPLLIALAVGMLLYVASELVTANWLAKYFAVDLKSSAALAAGTVSIFWGGVTVGRFAAGCISKHVSDVAMIRFSVLSTVLWQIVLLKSHSPVTAGVAVALTGLSMAAVWPTILAYAGGVFTEHVESAFSIIVAAGCVGSLIGPPLVGALSDGIGWRSALALCPAFGVLNIIVFSIIAGKYRR
jgi:fucose permease